jgi:hypothetical protein
MGPLREHSFELKGYLLRTNIIPHFVVLAASRLPRVLPRDAGGRRWDGARAREFTAFGMPGRAAALGQRLRLGHSPGTKGYSMPEVER